MKILKNVNLVLITLLSITAGISKIILTPQEVEFFQNAGLGEPVVIIFGIVQMIVGVLLIIGKVRKWGAIFVALMFALSTIMIFINGMIGFGVFSILPIILTGFIIRESLRKESHTLG